MATTTGRYISDLQRRVVNSPAIKKLLTGHPDFRILVERFVRAMANFPPSQALVEKEWIKRYRGISPDPERELSSECWEACERYADDALTTMWREVEEVTVTVRSLIEHTVHQTYDLMLEEGFRTIDSNRTYRDRLEAESDPDKPIRAARQELERFHGKIEVYVLVAAICINTEDTIRGILSVIDQLALRRTREELELLERSERERENRMIQMILSHLLIQSAREDCSNLGLGRSLETLVRDDWNRNPEGAATALKKIATNGCTTFFEIGMPTDEQWEKFSQLFTDKKHLQYFVLALAIGRILKAGWSFRLSPAKPWTYLEKDGFRLHLLEKTGENELTCYVGLREKPRKAANLSIRREGDANQRFRAMKDASHALRREMFGEKEYEIR